jgi:hypothetical protein
MIKRTTLVGGALAAAFLLPGIASATMLLDTGIPANPNGPAVILSASSWSAAEFSAAAGADVTSLSAYVTQGTGPGQPGDTFTFDIYSNSAFINTRSGQLVPLATATATYEADGWTTAAVNWIAPGTQGTSSDFWVALEVSSTTQTKGLDLPEESSNLTGTVPALGFATLSGGKFTETGALPIGVEVTAASPVPLPPAVWLLGSGLLGLAVFARRKPTQDLGATAA